MKPQALWLVALLTGMISAPLLGAPALPAVGTYKAEILGQAPTPPEIEKLIHTMMLAAASDPDWILAYREKHPLKPGERLPYDEKFGISAAEYARVVKSTSHFELAKIGEATVTVAVKNGVTSVTLQGVSLPVAEFDFDATGKIDCMLGTSTESTASDQPDPSAPKERWKGTEWTITRTNAEPGGAESDAPTGVASIQVDLWTDSAHRRVMNVQVIQTQAELNQAVLLRWPG